MPYLVQSSPRLNSSQTQGAGAARPRTSFTGLSQAVLLSSGGEAKETKHISVVVINMHLRSAASHSISSHTRIGPKLIPGIFIWESPRGVILPDAVSLMRERNNVAGINSMVICILEVTVE